MSSLNAEVADALREAGYNPDEYAPASTPGAVSAPAAPSLAGIMESMNNAPAPENRSWSSLFEVKDAPQPAPQKLSLPDDIEYIKNAPFEQSESLNYSPLQIDYAIRQNQNPAAQIDMYTRMDDIRRMAEVAKSHSGISPDELEATAWKLDMPPGLVRLMKEQYPDELEQRKLYAQMLDVAGTDSYFATRFSKDAQYQAYMRGHEMAFADIQAAVKNVYASNAEITLNWLSDAVNNTVVEGVYGIPAGLSQMARRVRETTADWKPQAEIPVDEAMTPEERISVDGMNQRIREQNSMMQELLADPEAQAQAARNSEALNSMDDWLQDTYQDKKTAAYSGDVQTGSWALDTLLKPAIQAVPSVATAVGEGLINPLLPLAHFGLQATTESFREMDAAGVGLGTSLPLSIARGLVEGGLETVQAGSILKGTGARKILGSFLGSSVTLRSRFARAGGYVVRAAGNSLWNAGQEIAQGAAGKAVTPLAKAISLGDPYSNVFSAVYESGGDLLQEGWGVMPITFLTGGAFGNVASEVSDMRKYNSFQKATAPLVAAGDAAVKGGKSTTEARQEIRAMAHEAVAKGGGLGTTVYADAADVESYLQGKPRETAEKTLAAIGVTPEAYEQAKADKTDIEIPIENLAVQEGGSDPELTKLFRPTPNMTTAAAIAQRTAEEKAVYDQARELRKAINNDVGGKVVPEPIRVFRQDLKNLGWKAEEADFVASVAWSYAKTQAERRGIDMDKFFASSTVGNIRAAMDDWIKQHPEWLAGVRDNQGFTFSEEEAAEEEISNADSDNAPAVFDPALGEGTLDIPEQPVDQGAGIPEPEPATTAQPVDTGSGGAVGQAVEPPAAVPQRTLFAPPPRSAQPGEYADALTGLPFTMETVSTSGVKTDPGAFQFKRDADAETGVKKGQEIPGDVNPAALGTMVFFEDVDGDRFVVSGHHRIDLLRRKGEEAEVRAVILRENDGWSTDQARVYGAALNIQEGGGDTDDYATFFRETRGSLERDRAEAEGLLRRKNAQTGYAIGALGSDRVFYDFLNGELTARQAATIATAAPGDHAIQDMIIERKIPPAEMETFAGYVKKMQNSGALNLDGVQLSLFSGKDHSAMLAAMEKESKAAAKEAAELDKKAASLESLLKAGKTLSTAELRKHGARAGDRDGLRLEAETLRAEAERWRKFFQHPDILAQVQERAGTAVNPEAYAQSAYHGSPHRFDRFSTEFMGSGEGNQAYGWGLYFSSDRDVSEAYRKELSRYRVRDVSIEGKRYSRSQGNGRWVSAKGFEVYEDKNTALEFLRRSGFNIETAKAELKRYADNYGGKNGYHKRKIYEDAIELLNGTINIHEEKNGNVYEVNIPDDQDLLDWNTEINDEQKQKIALQAEKEGYGNYELSYRDESGNIILQGSNSDGEHLYKRELKRIFGSPKATSEFLNRAGIKGIKYFGERNRTDGKGVTNYVIFDDSTINILEAYYQGADGRTRGEAQLYRADATHRQAAVIRVMKGADMSTVLHELSHIFLADMRDYIDAGGADIDAVRDYGKLMQAAGDLSNTENIEQVARWFEEYLREGRAPSVELAKPFGLFSKWLTNIYGNIRQYVGREMNPETRGVFDRWLASEREIAEAEAYYGGLRSANFLNLIDDEEKRKELEEKLEQKRQRIQSRYAGEMAKAWTQANADRDVLSKESQAEVAALPVYRAVEAARRIGMDRAVAEKSVGQKTVLKIIDAHGDIFARGNDASGAVDPEPILRKAGYHESDPIELFIKELSASESWEDAVKKAPASHVNRRRHFQALEAIRQAGGIDPDALFFLPDIDMEGLERHRNLFRPNGGESMDRITVEAGFRNPSEMLDALAKAPSLESAVQHLTERKINSRAREARTWADESLTEIMDATPPAGQSALHDPDEDAMAEGIELQRDAIRQAIEARTNRRQAYLDRRTLTDKAKQFLRNKPNREAMNYNNFAATERRWSIVAADAMAAGDREAALAALDKQQEYHALSTEAFRLRRSFADITRRLGGRIVRSELASVESAYRDTVRDILVFTGIVQDKSGRFAPTNSDTDRLILPGENRDEYDVSKDKTVDETLEVFAPSLETVIPLWLREKKLPRGYTGNVLDMTPAMLEDIDISVKTLIQRGRGELLALEDKDNQRVSDLRDKVMAVMQTLPDKKGQDDRKRAGRIRSWTDDFLAGNLSIEALVEEVDGFALHTGKEMGVMARMIGKIRGGEVAQAELLDDFQTNTDESWRTLDGFSSRVEKENGRFFNPDGVRSPAELTGGVSKYREWDPEMAMLLMFNAGNRGNLHALQKGFGLTDAELDTMFSLATEKEWLAVQRIAREMGKLFEHMDAVHYRMTNRHLERVRPDKLTVQTADGKILELDGWYFPLVFDPRLNDRAGKNTEAAEYSAVLSSIFNPQRLRDGFTHKRLLDENGDPIVTYAPLLKARVIADHMMTATRWITLAEPLMDFRRVTMDAEFKRLFIDKLGEKRYRDLRMWTNRMARPDKAMDEGMNRLIRKFRNASTISALGLNLRSAGRQVSSGGLAADAMSKASRTGKSGWYFLWRGLRKMGARGAMSRLLSPLGVRSEATEEMFRLSPEAKHRAKSTQKEIRDALNSFSPTSGKMARAWARTKESLFHFTVSVDHIISGAAFWGAYEQAATGNAGFDIEGLSQEEIQKKATEYANYIVRTQQSPYQADYTRYQANDGPLSMFTQFMGGLTPYLNNTYINVQIARRTGWKGTVPLATHLLNAYILPSIALRVLYDEIWEMLAGEEDEEEYGFAWNLTEDIVGQLSGGLPFVRDGARWTVKSARTGKMSNPLELPALQFINRTAVKGGSAIIKLTDGDAYAAGKDAGMAIAEILGVSAPIRQIEPIAEEWGLIEEE